MDAIVVLCLDPIEPEDEEDWVEEEAMIRSKEKEIPFWWNLWYQDRIWECESLFSLSLRSESKSYIYIGS